VSLINELPQVRGNLRENIALAPYTWLRVGGEAEVLFIPKDEADLAHFLSSTPNNIPIHILGVASNTLVRDGGVKGVVVRLGPAFGQIKTDGLRLTAGSAVLDKLVAKKAADAGIAGLEFYAGVPGTIGGALRMNAGCYGGETKDVLKSVIALDRTGRRQVMSLEEMDYSYRHCGAPSDLIFTEAVFEGTKDDPMNIHGRILEITARREASQPIREKTGGSTFKNPDGHSSWKLIEAAGCRGLQIGGAQISEQHCNFMINTGDATAADLEALGETVRERVLASQGVDLHWEVRRIGEAP